MTANALRARRRAARAWRPWPQSVDPSVPADSQPLPGELVDDVPQLQVVTDGGQIGLELDRPCMIERLGP